jgi:hypothetical protein
MEHNLAQRRNVETDTTFTGVGWGWGGRGEITALKFPTSKSLVLLVKLCWRQRSASGNKEGKIMRTPVPVAARSTAWFRGRSLMGLRVRKPPWPWISVSCVLCMLLRRGLCVGPITRPEESYRVWCVSEYDHEASIMRRPRPTRGCCAMGKKYLHGNWHCCKQHTRVPRLS